MRLSRRDFLRLAAAAAAAGRLAPAALAKVQGLLLAEGGPRVIWFQGSGCDGCAVSFLNSVHYTTVDDLLINTLDVEFQNNLMAVSGDLAVGAAEAASAEPGYVLVIEGAVPTAAGGAYCRLWPGMTMHAAVQQYAVNAGYIIALGSCASFGGCSSGAPDPTEAKGVGEVLGDDPRLINIPGCPAHPDWLVGTVVYLLTNGRVPPLDSHRRPAEFFGKQIHQNCFNRQKRCGADVFATELSDEGCMLPLGCKGPLTYADCYIRKWNSPAAGANGVNWCVGSRNPCLGCVEPEFPDGMSPFYVESPAARSQRGNPDSARPQAKDQRSPQQGS